jgi:DNA-binding transcriptional LysR family regulator
VAVVEHGSMAAAARALTLSPSAVAQQLHALERELGAPLIVRVGRTVRMTEQGDRILAQSRQLLRDVADLRSLARDGDLSGELRLGACTTPLIGMLPEILSRVSAKFPQINVYIQSGNSAQLYAEVEAGNLDAAFVLEAPHALPKTCEWQVLREEPLVVLAPRALAGRDPHALLREEPLIRYDRNQWGGRRADEYLRASGIVPRERFELNALNAIAVMVDRGLGVSLVPDWMPPWPEGLNLSRLPLPGTPVGRRIGIIWSRATVRLRLVDVLLDEIES